MKKTKSIWGKSPAHYGMPVKLFADSDKDGVDNVFDCRPFNKRRQDTNNFVKKVKEAAFRGDSISSDWLVRQQRRNEDRLADEQEDRMIRSHTPRSWGVSDDD